MTKLPTQREWAAERGLCKAGVRGRLPKAATEAIAEAIANGVQFADVKAVKDKDGVVEVKRVAAVEKEIADIPDYIRETTHEVYELVDGKKVHRSMREVCRHCCASLVLCTCGAPVIVARDGNPDGVSVYFGTAGYGEKRFW